ncbi:unnamed protein product [Auanema sp. JU1783]|nr:unnamed protein product [Auanema sp. JU1783]
MMWFTEPKMLIYGNRKTSKGCMISDCVRRSDAHLFGVVLHVLIRTSELKLRMLVLMQEARKTTNLTVQHPTSTSLLHPSSAPRWMGIPVPPIVMISSYVLRDLYSF